MIFSLLKIGKKTAAVLAGITIGIACLWGISMWQDISPRQLFNLFLGSLGLIVGTMLLAALLILVVKALRRLSGISSSKIADSDDQDGEN